MNIALFDTKPYDQLHFEEENKRFGNEITYFTTPLNAHTATMAKGYEVVCPFVNCNVDKAVIDTLASGGTKLIALRSAGFNNTDIAYAKQVGIPVVRVPAYSPHAVAEASIAMLLCLIRRLQHAYVRTREFNFSLSGLVGMDLYGKTVGVVGTGKIGKVFISIAKGFCMHVLAYDPYPAAIDGVTYVDFDTLCRESDFISLHCPLTAENHHIINDRTITLMKKGVVIINTSRGGLVDTKALLEGLKDRKIGGAGLDVYEEEAGIFFTDQSEFGIEDDTLSRLISMPNVLVTSHQGYLTQEALSAIAVTTLENIKAFEDGKELVNAVQPH